MAIVVEEKYKGQSGDTTSAEVLYLVFGTDADAGSVSDEDAFDAVLATAPATWRGIPGANIQIREELIQGTVWLVATTYGGSEGDSTTFPQSSVEYEFSFQAPSEKVYQSIATVGIHSAAGDEDVEMFGGAINVTSKGGETEVEGIDLPGGSPTSTWVYKPLHESITDAYQNTVESIMGDVNSFTFKGRAAGTMRFVSCDGGALFTGSTSPKWQIRYGFQFARNRYDFTVGGITVPRKDGHHLMWAYYKDDINDAAADDNNKIILKRPQFIIVEQVLFESNFGPLGLGF